MKLPALSDAKARAVVGTVAGVLFVALAVLAARTWGFGVVVALNTALCLLAVWIASGASLRADEAIDEAHQARGPIAPDIDEPWRDAEPVQLAPVETLGPSPWPRVKDEPRTEPIAVTPPTVPSNAAIDLGLADIDKWEAQQEAKFEALLADIRGESAHD